MTEMAGRLAGAIQLELHTYQAINLARGRPPSEGKKQLPGIGAFNHFAGLLTRASMADDPWADWWLILLEHRLNKVGQEVEKGIEQCEQLSRRYPQITVTPAESVEPVQVEVKASNPYTMILAGIIVQYDRLVRIQASLVRLGLLAKKDGAALEYGTAKAIRSAIAAPLGFRPTGVTREDVRNGNQRALRAEQVHTKRLGELPVPVVNGTMMPRQIEILRMGGSETGNERKVEAVD